MDTRSGAVTGPDLFKTDSIHGKSDYEGMEHNSGNRKYAVLEGKDSNEWSKSRKEYGGKKQSGE